MFHPLLRWFVLCVAVCSTVAARVSDSNVGRERYMFGWGMKPPTEASTTDSRLSRDQLIKRAGFVTAGGVAGTACGVAAGKLLSVAVPTAVSSSITLSPLAARAACVWLITFLLERYGFIQVAWDRIIEPAKKIRMEIKRFFDENTVLRDLKHVLTSRYHREVMEWAQEYPHVAASSAIGFCVGLVTSILPAPAAPAAPHAAPAPKQPDPQRNDIKRWVGTAIKVGKGALAGARSGALDAMPK